MSKRDGRYYHLGADLPICNDPEVNNLSVAPPSYQYLHRKKMKPAILYAMLPNIKLQYTVDLIASLIFVIYISLIPMSVQGHSCVIVDKF